jgi:hypothetical protein
VIFHPIPDLAIVIINAVPIKFTPGREPRNIEQIFH